MRKLLVGIGAVVALSGAAVAAPLTPTIVSNDINFGAFNFDGTTEYATNGPAPDTLVYTSSPLDGEVTASWTLGWPGYPDIVTDLAGFYAGDFVLGVQFFAQDAPYVGGPSTLDVSLVGTGLYPGADLLIFGATVGTNGNPAVGPGLLWAIDLDTVSLYGYSDFDAYILEGEGTIVGGILGQGLIGQPAVMRGNIDLLGRPAGFFTPQYDPSQPIDIGVRVAYSGETGRGYAVPEPATAGLLLASLLFLRRR